MGIKLKLWNGIGVGKYRKGYMYVAAFTQKHAAELISLAAYGEDNSDVVKPKDVKTYFHHGTWGNTMNHITPTEPCVYVTDNIMDENPKRII